LPELGGDGEDIADGDEVEKVVDPGRSNERWLLLLAF